MSSRSEDAINLAKNHINAYVLEILKYLDGNCDQISTKMYTDSTTALRRVCDEHDRSDQMYEFFKEVLTNYMDIRVIAEMKQNYNNSAEYIVIYDRCWNNFTRFVFVVKSIFGYIDQYYLSQVRDSQSNSLYSVARIEFKRYVFDNQITRLQQAINSEIKKDRKDEVVNMPAIKTVVQQFIYMGYKTSAKVFIIKQGNDMNWKGEKDMKVYEELLEQYLFQETANYFNQYANDCFLNMDADAYVHSISRAIKKEEDNADYYLQVQSKSKIIDIVLDKAITQQAKRLTEMNTGCTFMFENDKDEELKTMYGVFTRVPETLQHIINRMEPYIKTTGQTIVNNKDNLEDPLKFTEALLTFKKKIDDLIVFAFDNNMNFQKARDQAFQEFMNSCKMAPHYIVIYCDHQFKSGFKQQENAAIKLKLEEIIRLFCCLHGRDTFILSYTRLLAVRLLNKTGVSVEAEQMMINLLQVECGNNTVSKIKTMFEDINKSNQMMSEYKEKAGASRSIIDLNVQILTSGHWPYQELPKLSIPDVLSSVQLQFQQFYKNKFSNRVINFLYSNGNVEVLSTFLPKKYQFNFSIYQVAIVCCFNQQDVLTLQEILDKTGIDPKVIQLKDHMMKLCNPKNGIIKKGEKKPTFENMNEKYTLNTAFKSPAIKCNFVPLKTPIQMVKEGDVEKGMKKDDEDVQQQRAMVTDSIIVRIMKARKVLKHTELIKNTIEQTTIFKNQPGDIKKRIESLIEREYLERDSTDRATYIYKP